MDSLISVVFLPKIHNLSLIMTECQTQPDILQEKWPSKVSRL